MNEQSARNFSNIDNTTNNLIQGAALILSSASQEKNENVSTDFFSLKVFGGIKRAPMARGLDFGAKRQISIVIKKGRCLRNMTVDLSRIVNKTKIAVV